MNLEESLKKVQMGTASEEEIAYVARELDNIRQISAILDNPAAADPGIARADVETVRRARRQFNHKTLIRTVLITLCSMLALAALVCGIIFIPSVSAANKRLRVSKEEAVTLARSCLEERIGGDTEDFYIDYAHRHLNINGSLTDAVYVYKIEFENMAVEEYEIKVNARSGYAVITDVDLHH